MLNVSSKVFHLVIQKKDNLNNIDISSEMLKGYLDSQENIKFYAYILHDKDVNELGELKTPHYHVVIKLETNLKKATVLNDIVRSLDVNLYCVSIRVAKLIESVCYLTHEDCADKYHYSMFDVMSNDLKELYFILDNHMASSELSVRYLKQLCLDSDSISEVYERIGLQNSRIYRAVIRDIYLSLHKEL